MSQSCALGLLYFFYGRIWPNYIKPTGKDFDGLADSGELDFYAKGFLPKL